MIGQRFPGNGDGETGPINLVQGGRDPAVVERRLREFDQAEIERQVRVLDDLDEPNLRTGRPRKTLHQEIASRMIEDLAAGKPQRWVWRKYRNVVSISLTWLQDVCKDGRLQRMANGEEI